ncbi:hypothetical protein SRHO_G00321470 [Serrasalmus rhombeus]
MLDLSRVWWSNSMLQYCLAEGRRTKTLVGERPAQGWALLAAKLKLSGRDEEAEFPPAEELKGRRRRRHRDVLRRAERKSKRARRRLLEKTGVRRTKQPPLDSHRAGGPSGSFAERERGSADEPGRRRRAER